MRNVRIPAGAIFYGKTRKRLDVAFDDALRWETQDTAQKTHALLESGRTPGPVYGRRCENCSLIAECMPQTIQKKRSVENYLKRVLDKE